jgi:hypothetical protein
MFARSVAVSCLFIACVYAGSSDPIEPNLAVYLKTSSGQPNLPLQWMQRELSQIMASAGYAIEWRDTRASQNLYPEIANLAIVELRGICGAPAGATPSVGPSEDREPLASTPVMDGHILPFSTVNCDAVTRLLMPSLATESVMQRNFIYGRAVARIVAHELYHVLTGRNEHDHEGIAKAGFTAQDLVSGRFDFRDATLARLKPAPSASGAAITEAPPRQY